MKGQLYKAVEIKNGNSDEPVNYVGVHPLIWNDHPVLPEMGFVEVQLPTEKEIKIEANTQYLLWEDADTDFKIKHNENVIKARHYWIAGVNWLINKLKG